jgi:hypothetical protein
VKEYGGDRMKVVRFRQYFLDYVNETAPHEVLMVITRKVCDLQWFSDIKK